MGFCGRAPDIYVPMLRSATTVRVSSSSSYMVLGLVTVQPGDLHSDNDNQGIDASRGDEVSVHRSVQGYHQHDAVTDAILVDIASSRIP